VDAVDVVDHPDHPPGHGVDLQDLPGAEVGDEQQVPVGVEAGVVVA